MPVTTTAPPTAAPPTAKPAPAPPPVPGRGQLPADLVAIPAWAGQEGSPIKVCVLCRRAPDAVQGYLPQRRDTLDAKVFLGCLTDAHGVLDLLDLWVQSTDGLADAARARTLTHDAVDNAAVDRRWRQLYDVAVATWPVGLLACGFEAVNPPPTFLDPDGGRPVHPDGWTLCRDDDRLRAAGLPAYSSSLYRYLYRPHGGDDRFVPLAADAPRHDRTAEYDELLPPSPKLVPFNPGGGLMLVRPAGHLRLIELADLLGGKPYDGSAHGRSRFRFAPHRSLAAPAGGFLIPSDAVSSPSRLVETFLLKLQLWTALVEEVAAFTAAAGRPLLNVGPSSFAVRLNDTAAGLPALWTFSAQLTDAGDAVPIRLPQGDTKHAFCLPGRSVATGIYQPASVARGAVPGFGQLYLSSFKDGVFDGILTVADPIRPTARDVIRIRVPVVGQRADLYVKVLPDQNPSPSQLKVRSVPDDRLKPVTAAIEALIGVPLHEVAFEHYPLFSSAADAYSLAVLGVDLLLTPPGDNHAERFRDVLVLAARCREARGTTAAATLPLVDRVAAVAAANPDTLRGLGPQGLVLAGVDPAVALRAVTPELWWSTVALLLRMLPGLGPDSLLADFGDTVAPPGQATATLTGVYDVLLPDLRRLAARARSLLFGEWSGNRQVGAILDGLRRGRVG